MIDSIDMNSPVAAAKIPVRNLGLGKTLDSAAKHIPFESNATAGALLDMKQTIELSYLLHGINPFRQGQTVKGNRTMKEFDSIVAFSDLRVRMLAVMLEAQIFMPFKDILKLNILTNKDSITALNFNSGTSFTVNPEDFQDAVIEFKLADGYNPKSKIMSVDELQIAFQVLANAPNIGQDYNIGDMFAHMMSLRGVKNLQQYKFTPEEKQARLKQQTQQAAETAAKVTGATEQAKTQAQNSNGPQQGA